MAQYAHLKVFKDFYRLSLLIITNIRQYPRMYKFTLGNAIQDTIYQIMTNIVLVNSLKNKTELLLKTISRVELLQIQIRLSKDLDCFANKNVYYNLSKDITEILKQLEGWKKHTLKN